MVAGCLHHPAAPTCPRNALGTELFKSRRFCLQVVGLDVQVHAAGMFHFLQQDDRLVRGRPQFGVSAVAIPVVTGDRLAQEVASRSSMAQSQSQSMTRVLNRR